MNRTFAIGTLAVCLALLGTGCSRSPRVTFYTLEPAARIETAASATAALQTAKEAPGAAVTASALPAATAPAAAPDAAAATPAGSTSLAAPTATVSASAPAAPAPVPSVASVVVGPVTLPELVDRPQLVVRVAPNRMAILESERWAEPLRSQIPRVIAEDLGRLLGTSRVASYLQRSGPEPGCRVLLDIVRFEASPGEAVSVEAVWSLRQAGVGVPKTGRSRVREAAAGEGYDALVAAYGRALLAVSAELAQALRAEGAAGR
jgi:uncharacterized protein